MIRKAVTPLLVFVAIVQIGLILYWQTNRIVIHTQPIKDNELAGFFDSLKVLQISDLHIDRFGGREKKLADLIESIDPHLIFITGDFVGRNSNPKPALEVIERIAKNRKVIAILGNKDHEFKNRKINTADLMAGLKKEGVEVLVNQSIKLRFGSDWVFIIGLDDNYLWKDDFFKATANLPPKGKKILLAHSPDIVTKVNLDGISLVLSGHTHGGQVKLPFIGAIYTNRSGNSVFRFVSGLYCYGDTKLYVNRGIGTSSLPSRFLSRPEITIFKFEQRQ